MTPAARMDCDQALLAAHRGLVDCLWTIASGTKAEAKKARHSLGVLVNTVLERIADVMEIETKPEHVPCTIKGYTVPTITKSNRRANHADEPE